MDGERCTEYVVDDAREQSFIKYAISEKDSKFLNYDLDQEDIEDRCRGGVDLTNVADWRLVPVEPASAGHYQTLAG